MFTSFSKRNRQNAGQLEYRYDELPELLRVQIVHSFDKLIFTFPAAHLGAGRSLFSGIAQAIQEELGVFQLVPDAKTPREEFYNYFLRERDVEKCLDVIEIAFDWLVKYLSANSWINVNWQDDIRIAVTEINARFKEHAIGYEFQQGRIIRIDAGVVHSGAVAPAIRLLQQPYLGGANQEFLSAHEHFRHGRYKECLNECLKAFESTMKCICEKRGWAYNQTATAKILIGICEEKGLFPVFMENHLTGLRMTLESGVPTARNKTSGHGQGPTPIEVSEEFASYVLSLTATNILFLATSEQKLK